jgi:hypothetical protein
MLEPIECHSGELLELAVTASGGREYGKLQRLLSAGYIVRVDQPTVKASKWLAEALAVSSETRLTGPEPTYRIAHRVDVAAPPSIALEYSTRGTRYSRTLLSWTPKKEYRIEQ